MNFDFCVFKVFQCIHVEKFFQWNIIFFSGIQVELCFYCDMTQIILLMQFTQIYAQLIIAISLQLTFFWCIIYCMFVLLH